MLYVLSGIPASGKTTISTHIANEEGLILYNYDIIKHNEKLSLFENVCEVIYKSIKVNLQDGHNVIYDAPNHRLKYRQDILKVIQDIPCKKICVVLLTPFEECLKRNANREARLPDFVLHDIYNKFEFPTLDEGWDEIIVINNNEDIESLKNNIKNI